MVDLRLFLCVSSATSATRLRFSELLELLLYPKSPLTEPFGVASVISTSSSSLMVNATTGGARAALLFSTARLDGGFAEADDGLPPSDEGACLADGGFGAAPRDGGLAEGGGFEEDARWGSL